MLEKPLEEFFHRIANLQGTLYHISTALTKYSKIYQQKIDNTKDDKPRFALGTKLVISDLTGQMEKGWWVNYPTNGQHLVANYEEEVDRLIRRETGYSLAQAHEAFSTYLKDVLATYFKENPPEAVKLKVIKDNQNLAAINWTQQIRDYRPGRNNSELFKLLKKISLDINQAEINNNRKINLGDWYLTFSLYRHKITHSNGRVSKEDKDYKEFTPTQLQYLKNFFPYEEHDEFLFFSLTQQEGYENLILLSEYAFLIFKGLSIKANHDWKVLKHMK